VEAVIRESIKLSSTGGEILPSHGDDGARYFLEANDDGSYSLTVEKTAIMPRQDGSPESLKANQEALNEWYRLSKLDTP
jgi:hypothetical protein